MKLLDLNGILTFNVKDVYDSFIIRSKIESRLNDLEIKTQFNDRNELVFKSVSFIVSSGSQRSRLNALRFINEGKIYISKSDNFMKISWSVKLDNLYFISLCFSIGLWIVINSLSSINKTVLSGISLTFFLLFIYMGINIIKIRMKDIVNMSVYKKR